MLQSLQHDLLWQKAKIASALAVSGMILLSLFSLFF